MSFPILTPELVACIVKTENGVSLSRLKCIAKIDGNPLGATAREFGHVLATSMPRLPERWWDRVSGIAAGDEGLIDDILAWYRAMGISCTFDIVPPQSSDDLLFALAKRGFRQSGFRTVLYGVPATDQPPPASRVLVREQRDLKVFLDVAARTGFLRTEQEFWREYTRAQFSESRCYVAFVGDEPAAHAVMQICDGTALFNYGATIDKYRGHGCQLALLRARLADSAKAGCDLAIVQANPGSTSQRNIERAGMRVAFTKAIWSETNVPPAVSKHERFVVE
jgi:hypothetical protein